MKKFEEGSNQGFTLIEMLVVIIIISFLIGIVLTGTLGFQASARDTRRTGDLRNAQNFLELYFTKCGRYPGSGTCGESAPLWPALSGIMDTAGVTKQFPTGIPGRPYFYGVNSDGLSYTLGAQLERENNVLKTDIDDSNSNGVNCADPVYCISSS